MKKNRGISNIVAEAILISIVMTWMSFLASITSGVITYHSIPPLLDPLYCSNDTVYIKVIEPGWIEKLEGYDMYVLNADKTIYIDERFFLSTGEILKINSTMTLPQKIVFMSGDLYVIINRDNCRIQIIG